MKKIILLVLAIISFCAFSLKADVIVSVQSGGVWSDKSTWVNNTIPDENDEVVIHGTVTAKSSFKCKTVKVEKNAKLIIASNSGNDCVIDGNLDLIGCLEVTPESLLKITGKMDRSKQIEMCITNNGVIEVGICK